MLNMREVRIIREQDEKRKIEVWINGMFEHLIGIAWSDAGVQTIMEMEALNNANGMDLTPRC